MKRILLGMTALSSVVGLGSVGVFFAHDLLVPATAAQSTSEESEPPVAARDVAPTPIRLSSAPVEEPAASRNPFGGRRAQPEPYAEKNIRDDVAVDRPEAAADLGGGDIPDARDLADGENQLPATRAADPLALRPRPGASNSRYAEQPASAEIADADAPADDPLIADAPIESRPAAAPAKRTVDRYGRPRTAAKASQAIEEPAADEQPAEPEDRQSPANDPPIESSDDAPAGADDATGTGRPGDPRLSGSQAPTLTIEKTAPAEIQIGKPAKFVIKVRNAGSVVAQGVEIHDTIPQGTQLIETSPQAKRGPQGALVWDLGALKPGEEQTAELDLMPMAEGEIGSVATLHFRAEASVRTVATKPMLNMEVRAPQKVMKGQEVNFKITISNPGTGAATGVVVSENVPAGLSHAQGNELELDIGTLKPGETRELELGLMAAEAGPVTNIISAHGEASLQAEVSSELEVIAPQLQVSMTGPKRRYLERNATHSISISNPGTASAKDIDLVAVLPKELKFVEANNGGQFDPATRSVYWSLEELPPQETGTVTLTTLPLQAGDARLLIKSKAQQNLADQREEVVSIEGLAAINFQVSDVNDPIEVNGQTAYEVRVTNQGSKAASNIRLVALLPKEMKAISAEGPVRYKVEGQRVVFEPLKQLAPKADTTFSIKVQALAAGDLRLQVQVSTDEIREPTTKEEGTRVYGDE